MLVPLQHPDAGSMHPSRTADMFANMSEAASKAPCRRVHLTDEPEVMAHEHHAAIPVVDGSCQGVNSLHV